MAQPGRQPERRLRLVDHQTDVDRLSEVYALIRQIARRIEAEDAAASRGEGERTEQ